MYTYTLRVLLPEVVYVWLTTFVAGVGVVRYWVAVASQLIVMLVFGCGRLLKVNAVLTFLAAVTGVMPMPALMEWSMLRDARKQPSEAQKD